MKPKHLLIYTALFYFLSAQSQDPQFSQHFSAPLLINPSYAGQDNNNGRLIANYRNQWSTITNNPFRSLALSFDRPIISKRLFAGLLLLNDLAGDSHLNTTQIALTIATGVSINKSSTLKFSLQPSFQQRNLTLSNLTWNQQFNGTSIDPTLSTGETFQPTLSRNFDISAGLLYTHLSKDENPFHLGISFFHLTSTNYTLYSQDIQTPLRLVLHTNLTFPILHDKILLTPSFIFQSQASSTQTNLGILSTYYIGSTSRYTGRNKPSDLMLGLHLRSTTALIFSAGFHYRQALQAIFSFDLTTSSLSATSHHRDALELSLKYQIPSKSSKL